MEVIVTNVMEEDMDQVSGRGASARATQYDYRDNNECTQCVESGKVVNAAGFCQTCTDVLCSACIDQYKILRGLREHDLKDNDYMLNSEPAASKIEKYTIHSGRPIEAYCNDDDTFACLECFMVGHRDCKNVDLLSDLSRGVESSKEFLEVQKAAEKYKTLEEQYRQAIETCMAMNEVWHKKTLEDFRTFRSQILSLVYEIENRISNEADKLKEENKKQLRDLAHQVATYSEIVKPHLSNIDNKKASKKNVQLFLALKKTGRDITDAVHYMERLYQDIRIKAFNFSSDPTITANINKTINISVDLKPFLNELGTKSEENEGNTNIQTSSSPAATCISTSKVNIKSPEDSSDCKVFGMAELCPTQLILSDWSNNCLKLIDLTSSTIIKRRTLESAPWDISILADFVAVSLPFMKQIQIFTADTSLDHCKSITVSGECHGLHYTGDQLVVAFDRPEAHVQIIDLTGNVLLSFQHDAAGNALFKRPLYNTLSADNKLIYVSDYNKHTVTCLDTTGAVQWVYQDPELNSPKGVSTGGGGCINVSSRDTIHVISCDGSKLAVIPQSQSGVRKPRAVCYSSYHRTLYVSTASIEPDDRNYISKLKLQ